MATIETARAKWERKTARAGDKWAAGVRGKQAAYCRGLAEKMGVSYEGCMADEGRSWSEGVEAVGAAGFQAAIAGKGAKWAEKFREAFEPGR